MSWSTHSLPSPPLVVPSMPVVSVSRSSAAGGAHLSGPTSGVASAAAVDPRRSSLEDLDTLLLMRGRSSSAHSMVSSSSLGVCEESVSEESSQESGSDSDETNDSPAELRQPRRHTRANEQDAEHEEDAKHADHMLTLEGMHAYLAFANAQQQFAPIAPSTTALPSASSMRKAASAADFKTFTANFGTSSRRASAGFGVGSRNLGVLTACYNNPWGGRHPMPPTPPTADSGSHSLAGSANASSNSLVGVPPTAMRSSMSQAMLAAAATAASYSRPARDDSVPPLVPQFSLGSFVKYDGQPRKRRHEIAMVTDKLRDMQYEIGRLNRKIKEYEEDAEQWSLRYSRRIVILSNLSLGVWIFLLQFLAGVRTRTIADSALTRMFIPRSVIAVAAGAHAKKGAAAGAAAASLPLSGVLISGFLTGVQSSLLFLLSAGLQSRTQSWKRNLGFFLSTGYSLFLVLLRRRQFRPHISNWGNIVANIVYVAARYYFLHGLLVFNSMRIL